MTSLECDMVVGSPQSVAATAAAVGFFFGLLVGFLRGLFVCSKFSSVSMLFSVIRNFSNALKL